MSLGRKRRTWPRVIVCPARYGLTWACPQWLCPVHWNKCPTTGTYVGSFPQHVSGA
jgi:hypothetical protein